MLVVDDGGPATAALTAELDSEGTPYTRVDLTNGTGPQIDAAFLSDTVDGTPRAKYEAVVLPNDDPFPAGSPEMAAIASYEQTFGIRQVDAYTYTRPQVGLRPGYGGSLDGLTGQVTSAGQTGPFGYLRGSVPFEDNSPETVKSYGYLGQPLAQQAAGASFTTYVDMPVPGSTARGSLVGEYDHDGRGVWCDQLVRGMPELDFRIAALTGTGRETLAWELPAQVSAVTTVPLWGPAPNARAPRGRRARAFLDLYERFLLALLDPGSGAHFAAELYRLAARAQRGTLSAALYSEPAVRTLARVWRRPDLEVSGARPTLYDALTATELLEHALRPLAVPVPDRGLTHAVSGGPAALPDRAAAATEFHAEAHRPGRLAATLLNRGRPRFSRGSGDTPPQR